MVGVGVVGVVLGYKFYGEVWWYVWLGGVDLMVVCILGCFYYFFLVSREMRFCLEFVFLGFVIR